MAGFGNFRIRKTDVLDIRERDLQNPWKFYRLFASEDKYLLRWLRDHKLLAPGTIECPQCKTDAGWRPRTASNHKLGGVYVCQGSRHCTTTLHNSFFEKIKLDVRDVMLFVKLYLEGMSLKQISLQVGVNYSSTAVSRASMIREIMMEKVYRTLGTLKFSGDIEIDESLFGRKVKHHRGHARGTRIWIFGMIQRSNNQIILYPVEDRSRETLLPIIRRHVLPGSRIFSDGWSSYLTLNDEGYEHFVVNHKFSFTQVYQNVVTGERLTVHTNTIEGAWKHAKAHFKDMSGVRGMDNFESHLCEVMYRHLNRGEFLLSTYMEDIRLVYNLQEPAKYTYEAPIFSTLQGGDAYHRSRIESHVDTHKDLSDDGELTIPDDVIQELESCPNARENVVGSGVEASEVNVSPDVQGFVKDAPFVTVRTRRPMTSTPKPSTSKQTSSDEVFHTETPASQPIPCTSTSTSNYPILCRGNGRRRRYKRGLACPPQWEPKKKINKFHVPRQFSDSDDDFH